MVANILKNERRWGELEVRKTVVIDYKKGIVVKNTTIRNGVPHHLRNGAKVKRHHEAIVSPELANKLVDIFLSTGFEGGRHSRRVDLLTDIENGQQLS